MRTCQKALHVHNFIHSRRSWPFAYLLLTNLLKPPRGIAKLSSWHYLIVTLTSAIADMAESWVLHIVLIMLMRRIFVKFHQNLIIHWKIMEQTRLNCDLDSWHVTLPETDMAESWVLHIFVPCCIKICIRHCEVMEMTLFNCDLDLWPWHQTQWHDWKSGSAHRVDEEQFHQNQNVDWKEP